jgi:hypothetical protein
MLQKWLGYFYRSKLATYWAFFPPKTHLVALIPIYQSIPDEILIWFEVLDWRQDSFPSHQCLPTNKLTKTSTTSPKLVDFENVFSSPLSSCREWPRFHKLWDLIQEPIVRVTTTVQ